MRKSTEKFEWNFCDDERFQMDKRFLDDEEDLVIERFWTSKNLSMNPSGFCKMFKTINCFKLTQIGNNLKIGITNFIFNN